MNRPKFCGDPEIYASLNFVIFLFSYTERQKVHTLLENKPEQKIPVFMEFPINKSSTELDTMITNPSIFNGEYKSKNRNYQGV